MSYILDALKKAAEQRHGPTTDRRLLAPSAVSVTAPGLHKAIIAGALGVVVVSGAVWLWPTSAPKTVAKPVATVVATPATPAPAIAPTPTAPSATASASVAAPSSEPRPAVVAPPASNPRPAAMAPSSDARPPGTLPLPEPRTRAATPPTPRPAVSQIEPESAPRVAQTPARPAPSASAVVPPPRTSVGRLEMPVAAALPPAMIQPPPAVATSAPPRTDPRALKLEVIVYSEQRPQRWAFISGRKYLEGDTIGDGARVEEIQATAVILNEDGRRVTLRP